MLLGFGCGAAPQGKSRSSLSAILSALPKKKMQIPCNITDQIRRQNLFIFIFSKLPKMAIQIGRRSRRGLRGTGDITSDIQIQGQLDRTGFLECGTKCVFSNAKVHYLKTPEKFQSPNNQWVISRFEVFVF